MALRLSNYETIYGTIAQHWVIDCVHLNDKYKYVEITVSGYYNEDSYLSKKSPIDVKKVKVNWNDGFDDVFSKKTLSSENLYASCYEYVKNNVDVFKNSTDC